MIQAIFFDFNGVIIDDERLQMEAYQEVLAPYGVGVTEEQYLSALGMDDRTFVMTMFQQAGKTFDEEMLRRIDQSKTESHRKLLGEDLPLCHGVVNFLKAASRHFSLGIVSMATLDEVGYVLDRARLKQLFSVIVSTEDVPRCKPAPDCYNRGLEKLNEQRRQARLVPLLPEECLVVEDSPPGIQSGKEAGMCTLGVTNTVSESALRAAGANVVTHSLADWNADAVKLVF